MNGYTFLVCLCCLYPILRGTQAQERYLGQSCSADSNCSLVSNSECSSGTCSCMIGYFQTGSSPTDSCLKRYLGQSCSADSHCSPVSNSECSSGTCSCTGDYFQTGSSSPDSCLKRSLGQTCGADTHCSIVTNSKCSSGTCSCKSGFYNNGNTCTKRQLGQSCDATNQCSAANAVCSSRTCRCPSTYYDTTGSATGGTCALKVSLGGTCPQPTTAVPNTATCSDIYARCTGSGNTYTCQCISAYYDDMNSTDRKCVQKIGLGYSCPRSNACGTTNAGCVAGKCECDSQYYDDNGLTNNGGSCVLRRSLGSTCNRTSPMNIYQCIDSSATCLWSSGSYKCTCNTGFHQEGSKCVANKPLGETCSVSSDCSDPAAGCLNSKCTCGHNYYDSNGFTQGGTCSPMTNLQVTNVEFPPSTVKTNEITVTWSAPANYKQFIDRYTVEWKRTYSNSIAVQSQNVASSVTSLTLTREIESGRAYTVTIISINDQTQTSSERTTSIRKQQAAKPTVTSGLDWLNSDLDATTGTIKLAWVAAAGYVSRYYVQLLDGTTTVESKIVNSPNTHAEFQRSGLRDGYRYNVEIEARSESYDSGKHVSGETFTAEFKTTPKIPDPPQNGLCKDPTDKSITLKWSEPADTKGDFVKYHIGVYQNSNTFKFIVSTTGTETQKTVDNLGPGTSYTFRIYTENEMYNSTSYNNVATGCKTKAKMSEPPTNLDITRVTSRSFYISWMEPTDIYSAENYGYVLQIKDDQDKCVIEVIYTCWNCDGKLNISNLAGLCSIAVRTVLPKTKVELEGQLTYPARLNPDIAYTVTVTAINDAGKGYLAKETERTLEEVPQVPYNVTVSEIGTTSCTISWKINGPKPGKTNFTVLLMADSPATSKEFTVAGFDIRSHLAEGLEEYWSYNVTVKASTKVGAKTSNRVQFRTRPTAPGKVTDLKITEAPGGIYTWMQISWRAPAILFWNSIIKEYSLDISTSYRNATTQSLSHENDENHDYTVVVNVVPEETYTFKVYATNSLDMKGEITTVVKQAPAGVPVNIEGTLQIDIISSHQMNNNEDRQFTVTLVQDFFEESTNGQIQASGLIACAKDCNFEGIKTLTDFNTMNNWQDASQVGFTLYRVTNPEWMDELETQCTCGRSKRAVKNVEYTVGSDDCSNNPQKRYCNGPLKPGTSYKLVAVSCTNGGCLLSKVYGPFVTAAKEQSNDGSNCSTESIIIGVVLGFTNLLLLVYAGYATFIIRRIRADRDELKMSTLNKNDRKSQTYVNESFMVGVSGTGGSEDLQTFSNVAPGRESETEYSRLDDNTREDRTTYDIIQSSRQY